MNVIIEDKDLELLFNHQPSKKYKKLAKDVKFLERLDFVRDLLENDENVSGFFAVRKTKRKPQRL